MGSEPDEAAEWWTTTDVATYLGLRVATVSTYRKRGQMPAPDMQLGRTAVWKPSRIIEWHADRPRPGVGGRPITNSSMLTDGISESGTDTPFFGTSASYSWSCGLRARP